MKFNQIVLYNFGSYEGKNQMIFQSEKSEGNIVLIGGKNGAGKTTFFQALKLCLYGYRETGYQGPNAYYRRKITKYINNKAKENRPALSYVELSFEVEQGAIRNQYILKREWLLSEDIEEKIEIWKEKENPRRIEKLSQEEVENFENYLLHIIPPELFNLYFFDGERITDLFLDGGSGLPLKEAFSILCGYDNFDIMYRNFKRLSAKSQFQNESTRNYIKYQEEALQKRELLENEFHKENELTEDLHQIDSELNYLEKIYKRKGGISRAERESQCVKLRQLEEKREELNRFLKTSANDIIPFMILRDKLLLVKKQIEDEELHDEQELLRYAVKQELAPVLQKVVPEWSSIQNETIITRIISELQCKEVNIHKIFSLSRDEKERIRFQIQAIQQHSSKEIIDAQKFISESIKIGAKLKTEIEQTSIEGFEEYIEKKEELLKSKQYKMEILEQVRVEKEAAAVLCARAEEDEKKARLEFEKEAKKSSVEDLSAKGMLFLDKLQQKLYQSEIERVEELFIIKIKQLKRKDNFIDEIKIDPDFKIHVFEHNPERKELDVSLLSNGEKQIFIMALYWSLIQLSGYDIPFVIDTPFARIDTEHRENIIRYFFKELKGQVFILSTNEEIEGDHINNLKEQIGAFYMLENNQNRRTSVIENQYFEEVK